MKIYGITTQQAFQAARNLGFHLPGANPLPARNVRASGVHHPFGVQLTIRQTPDTRPDLRGSAPGTINSHGHGLFFLEIWKLNSQARIETSGFGRPDGSYTGPFAWNGLNDWYDWLRPQVKVGAGKDSQLIELWTQTVCVAHGPDFSLEKSPGETEKWFQVHSGGVR